MSRVIFIESGGVKIDFLGSYSAIVPTVTSHIFEDVDCGPASSSGLTIFGLAAIGSLPDVAGVSVDGSAASQVVRTSAANGRAAGLFQLATSGVKDVVVSSTNSVTQYHLGVWKLRGLLNSVAGDTDSQAGISPAPLALTLDVQRAGAAIALLISDNLTANPIWTNLNRDFVQTASFNSRSTGASRKFNAAQTGLSISATTPSGGFAFVGASWR